MTRAQRLQEQQEAETTANQEKADQASPKPVADTLTALAIEESGEKSGSVGLDDNSIGLADSLATSSEAVELRSGEEEELTGEGTDRVVDDVCANETLFSDPADTALVGLESPGHPIPSELRDRFKEETSTDDSLKEWRAAATARTGGFSWDGPFIRKDTDGPDQKLRRNIMKTAHDYFGHMGDRRTSARKFVWPGMARDISLWCKSCIVCQKQKKD